MLVVTQKNTTLNVDGWKSVYLDFNNELDKFTLHIGIIVNETATLNLNVGEYENYSLARKTLGKLTKFLQKHNNDECAVFYVPQDGEDIKK